MGRLGGGGVRREGWEVVVWELREGWEVVVWEGKAGR